MKKLSLAVILSLLINHAPATTIVIYITPGFVIMATDSKGVYTNAITYKKTSAIVSKIYKSGDIYFSLAGLTSNTVRSFDVARIVDRDLKRISNITNAIDSIKHHVEAALLVYLSNQKKNNYTLFKNNMEEGAYVTSIGIACIRDGKPYAHIIGFKVTNGRELKINAEEDFYNPATGKDAVYYLGTSGEINNYMNTIKKNDLQPVPFVDKLMNLQIKKTPAIVGLPVDMIKITVKEAVWIKRKKTTPVEFK